MSHFFMVTPDGNYILSMQWKCRKRWIKIFWWTVEVSIIKWCVYCTGIRPLTKSILDNPRNGGWFVGLFSAWFCASEWGLLSPGTRSTGNLPYLTATSYIFSACCLIPEPFLCLTPNIFLWSYKGIFILLYEAHLVFFLSHELQVFSENLAIKWIIPNTFPYPEWWKFNSS